MGSYNILLLYRVWHEYLPHFNLSPVFDLVGFYGISTIVGYLMSNPLYTYIYKSYI